jgi:uncharacterized protein YndB with AHSA1/START domain
VKVSASRELLASRRDVWRFVAEPYHLADWWPGLSGVEPDRRGLAAGARWTVTLARPVSIVRKPQSSGLLLVERVVAPELAAWHLTADRLDVELRLDATAEDRTLATLTVEGRWLPEILGPRRRLPRQALARLHALCQTAAGL